MRLTFSSFFFFLRSCVEVVFRVLSLSPVRVRALISLVFLRVALHTPLFSWESPTRALIRRFCGDYPRGLGLDSGGRVDIF